MPLRSLLLVAVICFAQSSFGQPAGQPVAQSPTGIRGKVADAQGRALPFASVLAKGNESGTTLGTMANEEGQYELSLPAGSYEVVFQYLGYKTLAQPVTMGQTPVTVDAQLEEQVVNLREVAVSGRGEDPALTVMRKAAAAARFHTLEVDNYTARTYVKGSGKVREVGRAVKFLLGKKIEKETGLKIGQVYVLESINEISFRQPNTVRERVVSNRSNFPPQLQRSGGNVLTASRVNFYQPSAFGNLVSPLSPRAFAYYTFSYEGMFEDRGAQVNKIRVTPRSKGDQVFSGTVNIIENSWAIHSVDLAFGDENTRNRIKQLCAPFSNVWMPVNYEYTVEGGAFGVEFEGRYVTNVRNYALTVNPKYLQLPTVVDEKVEREDAKKLQNAKVDRSVALAQQQLTRQQLRKLTRQLEAEDKKARQQRGEDVAVVRDYAITVDSLAPRRSNDFWNAERQVPLTTFETQGYQQADSLNRLNADKIKKDSVRNLPKFKIGHLLMGKTYNYGRNDPLYGYPRRLSLTMPLSIDNLIGNFYNSVDGYYLNAGLRYGIYRQYNTRLEYEANARYAFARNRLNGTVGVSYLFGQLSNRVGVSAGRFVNQFNGNNPISPFANAFYSLLLEQNFMKLYEKTFVNLTVNKWLSEQLSLRTSWEYARRDPLENNHFRPWINNPNREYTPNNPSNNELGSAAFASHNTLLINASLQIRPFARAGKYNEFKYTINRNKPTFLVNFRGGLLAESRFSLGELGYEQTWGIDRLGDLQLSAKVGHFFDRPQYLIDFKHVDGNQTLFTTGNLTSFRNLDYYAFSTADNYLELHADQGFEKLLLTQITPLRLLGVKESLFVNYFNAWGQGNRYAELGYGFQGGTSLLGLGFEVAVGLLNERYRSTVVRLKVPF